MTSPSDPTTEKGLAAVRMQTDTVSDREDAKLDAAERETKGCTDTSDIEDTPRDDAEADEHAEGIEYAKPKRRISWPRVLALGLLPGLALVLTLVAGFLKWQDVSTRGLEVVRIESIEAAKESTIAMLSYQSDTVEQDLGAARDRLTGPLQESYTQLIHDVVIPGAKDRHISAAATVPSAASVSAGPSHAVALVFVNQTTTVGTDPPADTASSVRVTLDKIGGKWLVAGFDPV